jgi:hypothetical protein
VLKTIYDKFGIALPLEDLFRWARRLQRRSHQGAEVSL